jgi:D-alanyl-lipoteichoic acid acyltransferase DltB (MBOAT superfamily)
VTQPSTRPRAGRLRGSEFALLAAQLAVVLLLIRSYRIEQDLGLLRILPVVFLGFLAHCWTPPRYRLPLFLALSAVAIVVILSPMQAGAVVLIGLALIGICHLPIPFGARVALLLLVGAGLAAIRAEWILVPWKTIPTVVLPVLGAMFMFRLMVYMYDLRHERQPASAWQRISYFFLLPNVCFLLFPVVDYRTFQRTYYDEEEAAIYQKGIRWMFRGLVHLLLYRLVYHHLVIPAHAVVDLADVVQYATSFWLLYMRISGQFHMAIGMLCLFGFNLPEANHLYYLSSSFTDLWRRANIYWKNFMQKVFFYPLFTRLKGLGTLRAVLTATVAIFVVTWLLHSYQWFWLRGEFPMRIVDVVFWGFICVGMTFNVWREMTRSKKSEASFSLSRATARSAKILGMFSLMSILWSFWNSSSLSEWLDVLSAAGNSPVRDFVILGILLGGIIAIGVAIQYVESRGWPSAIPRLAPMRSRASLVVAGLALLVVAQPEIQRRMWGPVGAVAGSLGYAGQNDPDEERETLGYYENLLAVDRQTGNPRVKKPDDWVTLEETGAVRRTGDLRGIEFVPGYEGPFKHATLRTNSWGFRDREYEGEKQAGTYRIAVLGASIAMGSGVENEETFENVVEEGLNRERMLTDYDRVEILNFSMAGFSVLQDMRLMDLKVLDFHPDMVLCVIHMNEDDFVRRALRAAIGQGRELGYPWLVETVERSGAKRRMSTIKIEQHLEPHVMDVMEGAFRTIAETSRRNGILPVAVYVPLTNEDVTRSSIQRQRTLEMARRAGFVTLSVESVFAGRDKEDLVVAPWDSHPNAFAHRLIADGIISALEQERMSLGLDMVAARHP